MTDFIEEHNHTLHLSETVYIMRSQWKISKVHAGLIELASSYGIKPKTTHELMSREASGRANLGFTELDQYNYLRTRQQKNLISSSMLIRILSGIIDYKSILSICSAIR